MPISDEKAAEILTNINRGVSIAASAAQVAAPIVAIYNPAAGAALATLAPVAERFIVNGNQMIIDLRTDMTPEELSAALTASRSGSWPTPAPLVAAEG